MSNTYFQFKQFTIHQDRSAMKVTTDACLFGAWVAARVRSQESGDRSRRLTMLDIGTGTGLLSLMMAQKNNEIIIDAIELDDKTFEQARENIGASPWDNKINLLLSDARVTDLSGNYDVILSNPPFYENELKSEDQRKNIARHNEGLLIPELLKIIKKYLKPGGSFFLLLPYKRNDDIRNMLFEHELHISHILLVRQTIKHNYFRIMIEGKLNKTGIPETSITDMAIKDEENRYTPAFIELLKDYYLRL